MWEVWGREAVVWCVTWCWGVRVVLSGMVPLCLLNAPRCAFVDGVDVVVLGGDEELGVYFSHELISKLGRKQKSEGDVCDLYRKRALQCGNERYYQKVCECA